MLNNGGFKFPNLFQFYLAVLFVLSWQGYDFNLVRTAKPLFQLCLSTWRPIKLESQSSCLGKQKASVLRLKKIRRLSGLNVFGVGSNPKRLVSSRDPWWRHQSLIKKFK